ncbi:ABC-type transport system involved in multi-copper enzyme maturation, permease component [Rivularia sp. PCC 7116]|uniref:ABC transporter permease n=1 Tax=Rivularia sp. PCC 7116 TaxID=373994 RepID=UPI00029EE24C|nr:ABC transporter permease subunit [Rivularia sp. PCC 7116]AFY59152.1 ABC-type transport system involved in multi-copper enzyme maturation, permease component [Rivularia sp. PCC 7116]
MNLNRVFAIANNSFREVVRDRILFIIGFYAVILAIAARLLPQLAAATEDKMFLDLGLAVMSVLSLIIAVFVSTGLINKEVEKRTILMLISKPVSRNEFIVGKYLGFSIVLALLVIAMSAIYIIFLQINNISYSFGSIVINAIFLILQLSLVSAIAIACSVFTGSILATALTFALYLIGNITQDLLKLARISENPGLERITQVLYLLLPDLSRLDLKNEAVYGLSALPEHTTLFINASYSLIYISMLLTIATFVFSRKEF